MGCGVRNEMGLLGLCLLAALRRLVKAGLASGSKSDRSPST